DAGRKELRNRWVVDCVIPGERNLAREIIARGYGCATKEGPPEFRLADFAARKQQVGLWAEEWAEKREGFPSKSCADATRRYNSHLKYIQRKAKKSTAPG